MQYTRVKRREPKEANTPGVYAELDELVRLQFKASGFSFLPRQPIHSILSGRHASRLRGRGLNFEELRGYLPGDDIRTIDWKVTARTREPHVRVYTEERDRPVWLLVDQRISMFFGSQMKMKSVVAAEAAAISAWRVLSAGDRVGAVVFNDHDLEVVPPHRSEGRVMQILDAVVTQNRALSAQDRHEPNPAMLNEALRRICAFARHDCLVVLITDGLGINDSTRRLVTSISEHNDLISLFVYDPLEQDLGSSGPLVFSDGKGQMEVNTDDPTLGESFRQSFQERLDRLHSTSRRYGIPLLPLNTSRPAEEQVREILGHHAKPQRY